MLVKLAVLASCAPCRVREIMRSQRPQSCAALARTSSARRPAMAASLAAKVPCTRSRKPRRPKADSALAVRAGITLRHLPQLKSLATATTASPATLLVHTSQQVQNCVAKNTFRDRTRRDIKPRELVQSAALLWSSTGSCDFADQPDGGRADWMKNSTTIGFALSARAAPAMK